MRDVFARKVLSEIPKLLTLLDRNPHSPTYGCFDRDYWHYKTIDFPCGMSQEFVYPLALAWDTDIQGNAYYRSPAVKEWVIAGNRYAARSAHPNGSCDDYFLFEQAMGASVFSLVACVESCRILGVHDEEITRFLVKRADWLASRHESGRLSNHHALILWALESLADLVGDDLRWKKEIEDRLEMLLSWQDAEGWFPEYEGFDPGYQTLTLSCLARFLSLREARGVASRKLREALARAAKVVKEFVHPDGSFGGEYTSRNTYVFFPYGIEVIGKWLPEVLEINDRALIGLVQDLEPCFSDDRIIGHHAWNFLLAWREFQPSRPGLTPRKQGRIWLKDAGILVERRGDLELYANLTKGGVFKLFKAGKLHASDSQVSIQVKPKGSSRIFNYVGHLPGKPRVDVSPERVVISGFLGRSRNVTMTPSKFIVLRLGMLGGGRFFPDLVRRALQSLLIHGKDETEFPYSRQFSWTPDGLKVTDQWTVPENAEILSVGLGVDQTSSYTAVGRTFQAGHLLPWQDLTEQMKRQSPMRLQRKFSAASRNAGGT